MTSTITASLTGTSGSAGLPSGSLTKSYTNTGTDLASSTQSIGTTYEQLSLPADISFPAHIQITNDSGSGTVSISITSSDTYKFASLAPGATMVIPSCPSNPYLKGDVTCQVAVRVCEE